MLMVEEYNNVKDFFRPYTEATFIGRCKRLIRGTIGLICLTPVVLFTLFFITIETGNYFMDLIIDDMKSE